MDEQNLRHKSIRSTRTRSSICAFTHTVTDRQTDRQTETERERQTERDRERERERERISVTKSIPHTLSLSIIVDLPLLSSPTISTDTGFFAIPSAISMRLKMPMTPCLVCRTPFPPSLGRGRKSSCLKTWSLVGSRALALGLRDPGRLGERASDDGRWPVTLQFNNAS